MLTQLVQPVFIAALVVLEVAVWQLRVALASRGHKRRAAPLGAVNAVLSVLALGQVVTDLDRPGNLTGYAVGVAIGVYLGVVADERFAADPIEYRVVVPGDAAGLAADLRARGWPVTLHPADGLDGPATVLFVAVDAWRAGEIERELDRLAPHGFRTSSRLRSAAGPPVPPGYLAMSTGTRLTRRLLGRIRVPGGA
jgi:uncharacterized protein YebE (UPF0316 family)